MQTFTYNITVSVPDDTDAGDVAIEMAEQVDNLSDSRPDWQFGAFVLESAS